MSRKLTPYPFTMNLKVRILFLNTKDGLLYFVKGNTIGSDFGFPRLGTKKLFKW